MVEIQVAISKAKEFANSVYGHSLTHLSVEEVEISKDGKYYLITLGWDDPSKPITPIEIAVGEWKRVYKVFYVESATGNVNKMVLR